jgi:O-methyltransferase
VDAIYQSDQYLGLLQSALTASLYPESAWLLLRPSGKNRLIRNTILKAFSSRGFAVVKLQAFDQKAREHGEDWPMIGFSMIGKRRLANIQYCLETVHEAIIPGDFVECGVWRGGASIFAKGVLNCLGDDNRKVWLCDSFEGMPVQRDEDKIDPALAGRSYLAVSLDEVRENFLRFGLLDDRVRFVKGWFSETLPTAPIERISVLRLDGDFYSSTMDALNGLYEKVSPGGFIIVDDYNSFKSCKQAITQFREERQIRTDIVSIDRTGVYFRKPPSLTGFAPAAPAPLGDAQPGGRRRPG